MGIDATNVSTWRTSASASWPKAVCNPEIFLEKTQRNKFQMLHNFFTNGVTTFDDVRHLFHKLIARCRSVDQRAVLVCES